MYQASVDLPFLSCIEGRLLGGAWTAQMGKPKVFLELLMKLSYQKAWMQSEVSNHLKSVA